MSTTAKEIRILDHSGIAPPPGAAEQRLPLTYFDMVWLYFHPIQRLLFYPYTCSTAEFLNTIVPTLKKSLSKTLSLYPPLAGNLIRPLDSSMPELRYLPGDSVSVTFAEANEAFDFSYLTGNQPRDADDFHFLTPDIPEPEYEIFPLLAIQVTIFPGKGISMGFTNHHAAGDASSIVGFIKAWSREVTHDQESGGQNVSYDRSVIKDPSGRRANIYWNQMRAFQLGAGLSHPKGKTGRVRATFVLQKHDIQKLRNMVVRIKQGSSVSHVSSFTVTTAYVWSCLAKAAAAVGEEVEDAEPEYFGFAVDFRHRQDPPVPASYFGNCIAFAVVESTHGRLKGSDGFFDAAETVGDLIGRKVNNKEELLSDADEWIVKYAPLMGKRLFGVAGSPKFDLYEDTDFGFGKPTKFESVSIDSDGSMSLCKSREFEGGLEIGMSLPDKKMEAFTAVLYDGLKMQI